MIKKVNEIMVEIMLTSETHLVNRIFTISDQL